MNEIEKVAINNIKKTIIFADTAALSIGLETLTTELAFRSKYKHERYYTSSTDFLEKKVGLYMKELKRRAGVNDIKAQHALEKMKGVNARIDEIISNQKDIYEKIKKKELFT
jgi:CII-binding regulator of phage lambda lysogenization HflD